LICRKFESSFVEPDITLRKKQYLAGIVFQARAQSSAQLGLPQVHADIRDVLSARKREYQGVRRGYQVLK
jgi:hypothetical protein